MHIHLTHKRGKNNLKMCAFHTDTADILLVLIFFSVKQFHDLRHSPLPMSGFELEIA
jgi:hypothetical protein